ncbi:acetylornithine deacetylase putative metallo- peptidase Clan MH Family M18 [Leptomonas seymouri]|uniref:Acetylornithine deacetylase putative metallo-peptidase Clan MH Family M18 n=1 Tax=Leptomonas seymouri TaxID=5684 RepID=A0A0N0P2V6_LEPSE|nr:acetylornithine deacetylase putative metallo- peptidase Clan MH Family M18 [Leptomonas seymouri]|eukprot:KPI83406.1 acetylornithine deacetylase putative metallo- peptidase Clan MH Family M18 [Leptomonas seymouri]
MPYPSNHVEWLEKLISFDTTSRNSNLNIVTYLKEYLESVGVSAEVHFNETRQKANLFAVLPSKSSSTTGGIVLSGHLDVVPVDGQKWDFNPFRLTSNGDNFYGRGTCDMKGFIAVCMSLVPQLLKMPRNRPVYLAWTYDEEVGCLGGRALTQYLKSRKIKPDGCLVGEPTSNKVIVAHKGICVWTVRVKGKAAHSSYALTSASCNAIDYAARLIVKIREIAEDIAENGVNDRFFDVPCTTMSTNLINGGIAINTVPAECTFSYEFRNLPEMAQEAIQERVSNYVETELLPKMKKEYSDAAICIDNLARVPSFPDAEEKDPFVALVRALTGDKETHKLGGATEAGLYALIGVPVLVCGPGSIAVAHQANEFVPKKDLEDSRNLVLNLVKKNQGMEAHM